MGTSLAIERGQRSVLGRVGGLDFVQDTLMGRLQGGRDLQGDMIK